MAQLERRRQPAGTAGLPCALVDIDATGMVRLANAAFGRMLGVPPRELVGTAFADWLSPASRALFRLGIEPRLADIGSADQVRLQFLGAHGHEVFTLCLFLRDPGSGLAPVRMVAMPWRPDAAQAGLPHAPGLTEPPVSFRLAPGRDGRLRLADASPAFLALCAQVGVGPGSSARRLLRLVHPTQRATLWRASHALARHAAGLDGEYRLRHGHVLQRLRLHSARGPGGALHWTGRLDPVSAPEPVLTQVPGLLHWTDAEGRMLGASAQWLERLGYTPDAVVGRRAEEFIGDGGLATPRGHDGEAPCRLLGADGTLVEVIARSVAERGPGGELVRVLTLCRETAAERVLAGRLDLAQRARDALLGALGEAVILTDVCGRIVHLNTAAERMTGWNREEAAGQPEQAIVHLCDDLSSVRREGDAVTHPTTLLSRDGREYFVEETRAAVRDAHGTPCGGVIVLRDVGEARAMALRMSYMAQHDPLTELPNRLLLRDRLEHAIAMAQRAEHRFALMFLDVDRFKQINDSLGHGVGDELLRVVSRRLVGALRAVDTVSRQGGDEFVILISPLAEPQDAAPLAQKILRVLGEPCEVNGHHLQVSSSVGIAVYPEDGADPETLLRHADAAMYRAKTDGRNRFHFFSAARDAAAIARHTFDRDLRGALAQGEVKLHFQPRVCAHTGRAIGTEALVRWRRSEGVLLSPDSFIPLAESCGLMIPLGRHVLREACRQNRLWQDLGLARIPVSVNMSGAQLYDHQLVPSIAEALAESGLEPQYLELEITETTAMRDADATLGILQQIKALGVSVAIDDFGTGYSSLSYLMRFPVDTLKIDQSFIRDLHGGTGGSAIVSAILGLGRSLRLRVVAEGVESSDQAQRLVALGCEEMQGYYYARPDSAERIGRLLSSPVRGGPPAQGLALAH